MDSYVYINDFLSKSDYTRIMDWLKLKTFKEGVNNDGTIIKRKQLSEVFDNSAGILPDTLSLSRVLSLIFV